MQDLITQADMETEAKDSLDAIHNNEFLSLDQFKQENIKWAKKNCAK